MVPTVLAAPGNSPTAFRMGPPSHPSLLAGQDWPTYLGNDGRTSNTTAATWLTTSNAAHLGLNWSFRTGESIASSTTEFGGVAYFGSWDGNEYAVNASTGQLIWKTFLGLDSFDPKCYGAFPLGVSSAPTVSDGSLYLGGNNASGGKEAQWYALNATTGAIQWSVPTGNLSQGVYNWASPLISGGSAYVGVASSCDAPMVPGELLQVNLTAHKVVQTFHTTPIDPKTHKYERGAAIWGSPSIDTRTGTVYAATGNAPIVPNPVEPYSEAILAFNASNISRNVQGQPGLEAAWQVPTNQMQFPDQDFGVAPTVLPGAGPAGADLIVAGNKNGFMYALNASDFASWNVDSTHLGTYWQVNVHIATHEIMSPAAYGGGLVYWGTPTVNMSGVISAGSVWAVHASTGQLAWNASLSGHTVGAPLYANGVLVVTAGPWIYVYNAATGHRLHGWKYTSLFVSAPSIAGGRVFEGNENDFEYALCVAAPTCVETAQP